MNILKEFIKKFGVGTVLAGATLDSYRRQIRSDRTDEQFAELNKQKSELSEESRKLYDNAIAEEAKKNKHQAEILRFKESAEEYKTSADKYNSSPTEINKAQMDAAKKKLDENISEIKKLDISETITHLYNKYVEYVDNLTPDKIVCLFNIIMGSLVLSSFWSILSIMLSENIINRITILEKYPKILNLLKLRNTINKKVSKFYLLMHLILILLAIIGNIFMYFL